MPDPLLKLGMTQRVRVPVTIRTAEQSRALLGYDAVTPLQRDLRVRYVRGTSWKPSFDELAHHWIDLGGEGG